MSNSKKSTAERGKFKQEINTALYRSNDIKELLLGDISDLSTEDKQKRFKDHVKSHLFIDDTIEETESFIFYDVRMPRLGENIKNCQVLMYVMCHRDMLDNYSKEGFYGNRADILSQMIEDCIINDKEVANSFGIGRISLDSIDIYNSQRFYGCIMTFNVPDFR